MELVKSFFHGYFPTLTNYVVISNEERLWGNLSSLTDDGRWLAVQVAVLVGN